MLAQAREDIRRARALAEARGEDDVVRLLDQALAGVSPEHLLTTTEAAAVLDVRSVNTLKALVRVEGLRTVQHGNRTMIPLSEVERIRDHGTVRGIRASDHTHDEAEDAFGDAGMSDADLETLEAARPGYLPWRAGPESGESH